ncbi:hypothetical protein, partial [Aeromonas caviae]
GDKIRSQTKPFLYLFQLVAAKDPVHECSIGKKFNKGLLGAALRYARCSSKAKRCRKAGVCEDMSRFVIQRKR